MNKRPKRAALVKSNKKLQVLLYGASGRMGQELIGLLKSHPTLQLAAAVDSNEIRAFDAEHTAILKTSVSTLSAVMQGADVVIDFSNPSASSLLNRALNSGNQKVVLIGTTGLTAAQKSTYLKTARAKKHKLLIAGNTSQGIASLARLAMSTAHQLADVNFDVEITETHHRMKADAPSGTALLIAEMIHKVRPELKIIKGHSKRRQTNTIGIHSVRGGGVFGEHEVRFLGDFEEVRISHRAFSRALFAAGALNLVSKIDRSLDFGKGAELHEFLFI